MSTDQKPNGAADFKDGTLAPSGGTGASAPGWEKYALEKGKDGKIRPTECKLLIDFLKTDPVPTFLKAYKVGKQQLTICGNPWTLASRLPQLFPLDKVETHFGKEMDLESEDSKVALVYLWTTFNAVLPPSRVYPSGWDLFTVGQLYQAFCWLHMVFHAAHTSKVSQQVVLVDLIAGMQHAVFDKRQKLSQQEIVQLNKFAAVQVETFKIESFTDRAKLRETLTVLLGLQPLLQKEDAKTWPIFDLLLLARTGNVQNVEAWLKTHVELPMVKQFAEDGYDRMLIQYAAKPDDTDLAEKIVYWANFFQMKLSSCFSIDKQDKQALALELCFTETKGENHLKDWLALTREQKQKYCENAQQILAKATWPELVAKLATFQFFNNAATTASTVHPFIQLFIQDVQVVLKESRIIKMRQAWGQR